MHPLADAHTHTCGYTHTHILIHTCIMGPHTSAIIRVQIHLNSHQISNQILFGADSRLHVRLFCPGRETWTWGNTLTGSPGVLTRVQAATGKEWLWEALPQLSSLSTDYEAGPRRVPLGTPQATDSLPLLCYKICR